MFKLLSIFKQKILLFVIDILIINSAIILSYLLHGDFHLGKIALSQIRHIALYLSIINIAALLFFNQYSMIIRFATVDDMVKIIGAQILSTGFFFISNLLIFKINVFHSFHLIYLILSIVLIGASRMSIRVLDRIQSTFVGHTTIGKRILIIGGGDAGAMTIKELKKNSHLQKIPVVILDDNPAKLHQRVNGVPITGTTKEIVSTCEREKISEIIISMPSAKKSKIKEIVDQCKRTNCKIKILPGLSELIDGHVDIKRMRDVRIEDLLGRDPVKIDMRNIESIVRGKTVLVTGGGGSIGSELCRQIAQYKPKKLLILDIYENGAYEIQQELKRKYNVLIDQKVIIASVRDEQRMRRIFERYRPNIVFHAAAHKHVPIMEENPFEAVKNNIFGTLNVVNLANEFKLEKFVMISTDKAVNPTNVMGATKRVCEIICQTIDKTSETDFVAVRFGNVLGSNGSVIPLFKKQLEEGGPLTVTHPEIIRYFMTIPEAVQLILQAGAFAQGGEIFVLDMGDPVKINDLAHDFIKLSGLEPGTDISITYTGLRPGEKLYEELLMAEEGLSNTLHEKIFIGKPVNIEYTLLQKQIEALRGITDVEDTILLDSIIRVLVPTYSKPAMD